MLKSPTHTYTDVAAFYSAAQAADIATIIVCYTDEWGPKTHDDYSVSCGPLQEASLLAYKQGDMYSCDLSGDDADRATLQKDIEDHGFTWAERERNSGKYGTTSRK